MKYCIFNEIWITNKIYQEYEGGNCTNVISNRNQL